MWLCRVGPPRSNPSRGRFKSVSTRLPATGALVSVGASRATNLSLWRWRFVIRMCGLDAGLAVLRLERRLWVGEGTPVCAVSAVELSGGGVQQGGVVSAGGAVSAGVQQGSVVSAGGAVSAGSEMSGGGETGSGVATVNCAKSAVNTHGLVIIPVLRVSPYPGIRSRGICPRVVAGAQPPTTTAAKY